MTFELSNPTPGPLRPSVHPNPQNKELLSPGPTSSSDPESSDDEFFTPGSDDLFAARKKILAYSVPRAAERIERQIKATNAANAAQTLRHRHHIAEYVLRLELEASYTMPGNTRALSQALFNNESSRVACASWDGSVKVWGFQGGILNPGPVVKPGFHSEKSVVGWSPADSTVFVSGGSEGSVHVWRIGHEASLSPVESVKDAHVARIAHVAVHPSGDYFATASFDRTWKLWDMQRPDTELMEQEGHSKEVFAASFHSDGSLLATGGLDTHGRIWDLRSGRSIAVLRKHVKGIYSLGWAPNGHHLASASGDNSVQIWDLRQTQRTALFSIPSHTKLVSGVKFLQNTASDALTRPVLDENDENERLLDVSGTLVVTSSFDGTVKVWSADNWVCLKTLRGHADKVMSCDISADGTTVISTGWDRSLKTWRAA